MTKTQSQKARKRGARKPQQPRRQANQAPKRSAPAPRRTQPRSNKITGIGRALREGGATLGGLVGLPSVGTAIGSGLSRIFGQGDYAVSQNSFMQGGIPTFSSLEAPFRFKHKELIGTVNTSQQYAVSNVIHINPGLMTPILSSFASNFTMYKFHGLVFVFNSSSASSVGSTNTALGVNGMVVNYDPAANTFPTRSAAEQYVGCQSSKVSDNLMLPVECKPNATVFEKRFVRTGDVPTGHTIAETDLGLFQFFSDGVQSASQAGELWVSYDIEFFLPKVNYSGTACLPDYYAPKGTNPASTNPFALVMAQATRYTRINSSNYLEFLSPGTYHIMMSCTTATYLNLTWGSTTGNGCTASNTLANGIAISSPGGPDTLHILTYACQVPTINDPSQMPFLYFTGSTAVASATFTVYRISTAATGTIPPRVTAVKEEDDLKNTMKKFMEEVRATIRRSQPPTPLQTRNQLDTFVEEIPPLRQVPSGRAAQSGAAQPGRIAEHVRHGELSYDNVE